MVTLSKRNQTLLWFFVLLWIILFINYVFIIVNNDSNINDTNDKNKEINKRKSLTFVIGGSALNFDSIVNFIRIYDKQCCIYNNTRLIIYDLGLGHDNFNCLQNTFNHHIFKTFNYSLTSKPKAYPIIIKQVGDEYGDCIVWMDPTNKVHENFEDQIYDIIHKINIYSPINKNGNRNEKFIAINYNIEYVQEFINDLVINYNLNITFLYHQYQEMYNFKIVNRWIGCRYHSDIHYGVHSNLC